MNSTATASLSHTQILTRISLMTALLCIFGPLSLPLPFSPVPISLTNLVIYFAIYLLGWKYGTISFLIYLLLGAAGLPVFSGGSGGVAKLLGPTGGYLFGFALMALVMGLFMAKWPGKPWAALAGMLIGTAICYILGTLWLSYSTGMSLGAATAAGVLPFLPGDGAKILIALLLGHEIQKRLQKAGLL